MKKFMKKVADKFNNAAIAVQSTIANKKAEGYVDSGVKILIAVVIGALLLGGLYALFKTNIMPTVTSKINRLMRDCKNGKVDYILTKSISRFARNTVDSLTWTRKLRAMGIGVYFEEQAIDSLKAENEMLIGLFSVIAQSESENISANVKWGFQQRMKNGTFRTNFRCLGYNFGDDGVPVIVESEAKIVREIFQHYIDGDSLNQIGDYLRDKGYKTIKQSSAWSKDVIKVILTNEKYVGDVVLQKTFVTNCIEKKTKVNNGELPKYIVSNNHPPIIDRDTFNVVQVELASRNNIRKKSNTTLTERGKYSGLYALTDVLICGSCGSHYKRKGKTLNGKRVVYWRCINRMEKGKEYCSDSIGIEEAKLHRAICKCLSEMMEYKDEVVSLIEQNLEYALTGNKSVLDSYAIENQIEQYNEQASVLMERMDKTNGDKEIYENEIKKLFEKISALREQLSTAKSKSAIDEETMLETRKILEYIKMYDAESFSLYSDITVRRLVESIVVKPEGKIAITLKGGFQGEAYL